MINRTIIAGRFTSDPTLRQTQDGISVVNFNLAVERSYRQKDGEKAVDFFSVIAWRKLAELVSEYCYKGMMVAVDGHLQSRKYEDKDGNQKQVTELVAEDIQFMSPKKAEEDPFDDIPL